MRNHPAGPPVADRAAPFRESAMRRFLLAALPLLGLLAACNTVKGAGEDLSNAGHAISNAAEKVVQ